MVTASTTTPEGERRIYGPPGTGKTTYLSKQVDRAARAVGSDALMIASFTKTAATELAGRKMPVGRDRIGTLHSFAYRALERPVIYVDKIDEWNKHAPHLRMSGGKADLDHAAADQNPETTGDELMNKVEILRGRMVPQQQWPPQLRAFYTRWCEWKQQAEVYDFTDLIESCIDLGGDAPGHPRIGFFDEVQDFTPLELELVRRWGSHMDTYLLAGDDDQAIFTFKGAMPEAFLDPPIDDSRKMVLSQSYRVPRAVHEMAQAWVRQLSRREPKQYAPRDADGSVRMLRASWRNPENAIADAKLRIEQGQTVMFLSTCAYMLDPVKAVLRKEGLPFWNPYRRNRGDWNPLVRRDDVVTASDRLLAFVKPDERLFGADAELWSWADVDLWLSPMRSAQLLRRGAKATVSGLARTRPYQPADLAELDAQVFASAEELGRAWDLDVQWWLDSMLAKRRGPVEYPAKVLRNQGPKALIDDPPIIIGTVHSVKGGQADHVYLFPDLSPAGAREWVGNPVQRDGIIRQMYVGITRARERLILCQPSSSAHVDMRRFAPRVKA